VKFTVPAYTVLEDFKLEGVTPTSSLSGSTYTVTFNNVHFSTVKKQLTFKAYSTRTGSRTITTAWQYPRASNCITGTGTSFNLNYPSVAGTPKMVFKGVSARLTPSLTATDLTTYDLPMDGVTPRYAFLTFKNEGDADAYDVYATLASHVDLVYVAYSYISDLNGIRYSIDGGDLTAPDRITPDRLIQTNRSDIRTIKPGLADKYTSCTVYLDGNIAVPQESTITFMVPIIEGDIYDNSDFENVPGISPFTNSVRYYCYAKNLNGVNGISATGYSELLGDTRPPSFNSPLMQITVRPDVAGEASQSIHVYSTTSTSTSLYREQTISIYVQLPEWMELDGPVASALSLGSLTPISFTEDNVNKIYSIEVAPTATSLLKLKYKSGANPPWTVNRTDSIRYWLNWNLGCKTAAYSALRPVLAKIAKRAQPVTLMAERDGIVLDSLYFQRTTRGERDSNNNEIPDGPGKISALDDEINHTVYRQMDEGKIIIEGRIAGSTAQRGYFYLALNSNTSYLQTNYMELQAAVLERGSKLGNVFTSLGEINGNITPVGVDNSRVYLKANTGMAWNDGDYFRLSIPFKMGTYGNPATLNDVTVFSAEAYLSNDDITTGSDILNPPDTYDRYGKDMLSNNITVLIPLIYSHEGTTSYTFANMSPYTFPIHYFRDVYGYGNMDKEYRPLVKPTKLVVTTPVGYVFLNDGELQLQDRAKGSPTSSTPYFAGNEDLTIAPSDSTANSNGTVTYTYNFDNIFQDFYDTSPSTGSDGKWILSPGNFIYFFNVTVQPTREATTAGATAANRITYDNLMTGATNVGLSGVDKTF
jgi:hypothetical protein